MVLRANCRKLFQFVISQIIIEWEVVNLNNVKSSMFITFISLLILNMLIIFFGLYSYFFEVKDYTLIAGIIAFGGAIIGGSITLIGVQKTIEANHKVEKHKKLNDQLMFLLPLQREIEEISDYIHEEYNLNHMSIKEILKDVLKSLDKKNNLYDYAQKGNLEAYFTLILFDQVAFEIYEFGHYRGLTSNETCELLQRNINAFLRLLRKDINLKRTELDRYT